MGVLAPGSAHAKPSAQLPIDTSRNFSAHVSGRGDKKIENLSDQFTQAILSTFHFFCKKTQKNVPPGAGVLRIFVHPKSYFFVSQTPMQNVRTLLSNQAERRKKEEKQAEAELCQGQDQLGLPAEAKLI